MNVDAINNLLEEYYLFEEYTYAEIFVILVRFIYEFFFMEKYQRSNQNKRSITPPKPVNYTEYSFAPACGKFDPKPVKFKSEYSFNSGERHDIKRPKPNTQYKFTPKPQFNHKFANKTYVRNRYFQKPQYKRQYPKYDYNSFIPPRYEYKPPPPSSPRYEYKPPPRYNIKKTERQKAFEILGLQENCDEKIIKKTYHKLALRWHPDKNNTSHAEVMFKKINKAYELVKP